MITLPEVENTLTQQGSFCLLDWLLQDNQILYTDYERWRNREIAYLEKHIGVPHDALEKLCESVVIMGEKLQLEAQQQDFYCWSSQTPKLLHASKNKGLHRELTQRWIRLQDIPQMDLFMDNSAVVTENTLIKALESRQFDSAQTQLTQLTALNSSHNKLGHYQDLINYGHHMVCEDIDPSNISAELEGLENEVAPLAKTVLRQGARDYLAAAWRRIANNLQDSAFDASQNKLHSSYALMQIPDWHKTLTCLSKEKQCDQQATLLLRKAQCLEALKKHQQALICWCLLMELSEESCEAAIEAKASPMVWELWQDFLELNAEMPSAFFPAYLFLRQPGLTHHLQDTTELRDSATTAVIEALQARMKTEDEIPYRKRLQNISPALLQLFIAI